jgi:hypothetical protein
MRATLYIAWQMPEIGNVPKIPVSVRHGIVKIRRIILNKIRIKRVVNLSYNRLGLDFSI